MLKRASVVFVLLLIATVAIARAERAEQVLPRESFEAFPLQIGEWFGRQQPPIDETVLTVLNADDILNRIYYTRERVGVGVFAAYYASQRRGDAIHSPLNCLPGAGWEPVSDRTIQVPVPGRSIEVNRYVIRKGLDRQLVLYWYQSHGRAVASEYWSKLFLVTDAVRLNRTDAAIVRVIAPIVGDTPDAESKAEQAGTRFIQAMYPVLGDYLPS